MALIFQSWEIRGGWGVEEYMVGKWYPSLGTLREDLFQLCGWEKGTSLMVIGEHELSCLAFWEDQMGNFGLSRSPYDYHIDV